MDQASSVVPGVKRRPIIRHVGSQGLNPVMPPIEITVRNGVAYVDYVPIGVTVRVTDYDVDQSFQEASVYKVSANTVQR